MSIHLYDEYCINALIAGCVKTFYPRDRHDAMHLLGTLQANPLVTYALVYDRDDIEVAEYDKRNWPS